MHANQSLFLAIGQSSVPYDLFTPVTKRFLTTQPNIDIVQFSLNF